MCVRVCVRAFVHAGIYIAPTDVRVKIPTPMMALSSAMVTCLALSTAWTTCCWCCRHHTGRGGGGDGEIGGRAGEGRRGGGEREEEGGGRWREGRRGEGKVEREKKYQERFRGRQLSVFFRPFYEKTILNL